MSEDKYIYIITKDIEEDDACDDNIWKELLIFSDLPEALNQLSELYKNKHDFKYYNYHIKVYVKVNNKYLCCHQRYYHQKGYK